MFLRKIALAGAALGMATAPLAAETYRDAAPVGAASELEGQSDLYFILGAAAIIAGIILIASDDEDAVSP